MIISSLEKLSLTAYPGHRTCVVRLGGCNLRCLTCAHRDIWDYNTAPNNISVEELLAFLQQEKDNLDAVCICGGEPLIHFDLADLLHSIKALGYLVKLNTNGLVHEHLCYLLEENLVDYVAMDLKNSPERYPETVGAEFMDISPMYDSITLLMQGNVDYEFSTTVTAELHDANAFYRLGELTMGAKRYVLRPFAPCDGSPAWLHAPEEWSMEEYASIMMPYAGEIEIRT